MQHFLYENNLHNSFECHIIGVLDTDNSLPSSISPSKSLSSFYDKNKNELEKSGDWILFANENETPSIILHCGKQEEYDANKLKLNVAKIAQNFKNKTWSILCLSLPQVESISPDEQIKIIIMTLELGYYQFLNYKSEPQKLTLETIYHESRASQEAIIEAQAIMKGIRLCQDLANTPANDCTPIDLENVAKKLAKEHSNLRFSSLNEKEMRDLGMNTLLSVAQGSQNPPRLIELHYNQAPKNTKPIVLVGKGITFDSGGINIKPSEGMYEMKYDMSGAATVLGVLKTIALLQLPIHVIGILACAENMPSGSATRPGDVIKSMQGTTIEITNTDAEGRLVLADAMCCAQKYTPQVMIDIATLTGAVIIALGSVYTGLMTTDEQLAQSLFNAGQKTLDKIWRLPMDKEYEECLISPVADIMNSHNSRAAGTVVAAHFLQHFSKNCRWAHLDIAGSAWISGSNRQATGRPVSLLIEWIKQFQ
jgi:leucyl aminopeptidase